MTYFKFNPAREAAEDFNARAAEECMKDPDFAAKVHSGEWCALCYMERPCICDADRIAQEMQLYLDECTEKSTTGKTILIGDLSRAKSRNWGQGKPIHEMLVHLYWIVEKELSKLRRRAK